MVTMFIVGSWESKWAIDDSTKYSTGKRIGNFETFERVTKKVECPKGEYI